MQYGALYPLSLCPCQGNLFFGGLVLGQNGVLIPLQATG